MMGKTLKHVRLLPFSTSLLSLPGRNEVACSGEDMPEDVGVVKLKEEMKLHALEEMLLKMWVWPLVKLYQNHCHQCLCQRELYLIIHACIMYYIIFMCNCIYISL